MVDEGYEDVNTEEVKARIFRLQADRNAHPRARLEHSVALAIVMAGVRGERRHSIASDGNDRIDVKAPHPYSYVDDPNIRKNDFDKELDDLTDSVSLLSILLQWTLLT